MYRTAGQRFIEIRRAALVPKVHPLPSKPHRLTLEEQDQLRLWIVSLEGMMKDADRRRDTYLSGTAAAVWAQLLIRLGIVTEAEFTAYLDDRDAQPAKAPRRAHG